MLIDAFMTQCERVIPQVAVDRTGGFGTAWIAGDSFKAAIVKDSTMPARVAEKNGVAESYTITFDKSMNLAFHDVIRRVRDGATFRVTSNATDSATPSVSSFQFAQVTAEKWELVQ